MTTEHKRHDGQQGGGGEGLIPKHGGYRNTKSWQLADLIYDVTVRFCDKFVDRRSRTHDQMVQAARSGCQNLLEGGVDSAISKKSEMKLTGIAKGSLEELRQDYRKFLAHRSLPEWPPEHPALQRFRALRCATLEQFRAWVAEEVRPGVDVGPCGSVSSEALPAVLAANGALALLERVHPSGGAAARRAGDRLRAGGRLHRAAVPDSPVPEDGFMSGKSAQRWG